MTKAYRAEKIFTGEDWLTGHTIITEDDIICEVIDNVKLPANVTAQKFDDCFIVPAFIDLQIYGADGKLFAVYPESDTLFKLYKYCKKGGASYCLPTVATNKKEIFFRCIDAVKEYWKNSGKGVLGLHIEGPWINPMKRGAHIESLIHSPTIEEAKEWLDYGKGVIKMITLAPEVCSKEIIDLLLSHNIIISAGHSSATYEEAIQSFEYGISSVTHLYNAMSGMHHREPGLVGAVFNDNKVMASIIPDGHHVNYAAISIAKKIMNERLFAITDAVTETEEGLYKHKIAGDKYEAEGILSGSSLTMNKALQNLVNSAGIELSEALRMCSLYPARLIKSDHELGKIAPGYKTPLVVLDKQMNVVTAID